MHDRQHCQGMNGDGGDADGASEQDLPQHGIAPLPLRRISRGNHSAAERARPQHPDRAA